MKNFILKKTIFIILLIINFNILLSVELPIGLTAQELTEMDMIDSMTRETDPPPGPVRNIAEFERMNGVLIRYPFGISTSIIKEMAEDVIVYCLVSSSQQNSAYNSMNNGDVNMNNIEFITGSTDSYWTRDYGPWWVVDGNDDVGIVDFTYNRPRPNDNQAPQKVADHLSSSYFSTDMVTTGGNYMTDGLGLSAATHIAYTENNQCNTNNESSIPLPSCNYVDNQMNDFYGINEYHVVADPNDEYIDHIDCWAKFLSPQKLLIRSVPTSHSQYNEIESVVTYFESITNSFGEPWEIFRVYTPNDQPYTNSLILNEKVLVPIMNSSWDDDALAAYENALPGYEVLGFTGSWQSTDALHCRTKGIPDLNMLQIFHNPIDNQSNPEDSFVIETIIDDLSNEGLIYEELKAFWWTDQMNQPEEVLLSVCPWDIPDCYVGSIPSLSYDSQIKYYIQALDNTGRLEKLPMAGYYEFDAVAGVVFDDGDVNQDNQINVLDIVLTVNFVLDSGDLNQSQQMIADMNSDGIINILDIILIVNIIIE